MQKPSLRYCVDQLCLQCRNNDVFAIGNCEKTECPVYSVRPNQQLLGKAMVDYSADEVKQEVLDAMNFNGLKEFTYV